MELQQLKYFQAVAKLGQINRAAEQLFVSTPAVSVSIHRLEQELGVSLFDRHSNRVVLNDQGAIFLSYVDQIFSALERAQQEMVRSLQEKTTTLTIGVTTSNLWMKLLSSFSSQYPNIKVSCITSYPEQITPVGYFDHISFLLADKHDVNLKNLCSQPLFQDRAFAMLPASHPLADRPAVSLQELAGENLFIPIAGQSMNLRIRKLYQQEGLPLTQVNECSNVLCEFMVADNRGIGFASLFTQHTYPNVRHVPLTNPVDWEQRVYWAADRVLNDAELTFKQFLIDFTQSLR